MGCKCRETRRQAVNRQKRFDETPIVYGEIGLDKMQGKEDAVGFVTGYRYPFSIRSTMFVDKRDAVYLLGENYQYAGL
jgi:hypothetical protein